MNENNRAIVRRQSVSLAPRTLVPEDVNYSVSSDAVMITRQVWTALRRRWRLAFGIFAFVILAVTAGTILRPVNYRATGLLEIRPENTDSMPVPTLFSAQRLANDSIATQIGILQSVTLAERVVGEGYFDDQSPSWLSRLSPMNWWNGIVPDDLQQKVQSFQEHLTIAPQEGSRLVRISFDSSDPKRASNVVNSVLKNYLQLRLEDTDRTAVWLTKQREDARTKLDASQRKLQDYVQQHGLQVLETGQGETENLVNDRLKQLHAQLIDAQAQRYQQQSAYEQASRQAQTGGSSAGITNRVTEDLSVKLADLERDAAGLSATFHEDYPHLQEVRKQIKAVQAALAEETQQQVTRSERDYEAAMRKESLIQTALARQQQTAQALEGSSAGYASLKRELTTDQQLYEALDQKLKEVSISGALKATNAGVLDFAQPPRDPYQSPLTLNLALGIVLGVIGGVGGALMRNSGDNRVHRVEDVDGFLGVRAVGVIPHVPMAAMTQSLSGPAGRRGDATMWNGAKTGSRRWFPIGRGHEHRSVLADAFAALRSAVIFNHDSSKVQSLLITSPCVGDGKTTVSVNLALSLARLGNRVLLIDADMRHPSVHDALGLTVDGGLGRYLSGHGEWWEPVHADVFPNFSVMPAGFEDAEPADLLASARMRQLLDEAGKAYDHIVIDSPPLLPHLADSRILAELADGVLLTVRGGSTQRDVAMRAVSQLNRVLGIVVNGFDMREIPPYYRETWPAGAGGVA